LSRPLFGGQVRTFGLLLSIVIPSCASRGNSSSGPATVASAGASPAHVSLTKFFNTDGIYPDGANFSNGDLDGFGFACSSNLLSTARSWNGVQFQLGTADKGSNVVSCSGQTVPLPPGKFSKLEMLAIAVNGEQESQDFAVTYANTNLNQTFTQSLSDWYQPAGNRGESQAVTMNYRNQSDGTRDARTFYIYGYSFNLNPAGDVQSLVLPDNNNVKVFAITLVP
jgi:hypothetical protein